MIPNLLWQTYKNKDVPFFLKEQSNSWRISNSQLEIKFMDDIECSNFILEHFGKDIHTKYLQLPQPINRVDFWRLAVVYIHGGYYSDLDITCNANLKDFINLNVKAVFLREHNNISNYFFGAIPKHPVIKMAIDKMLEETLVINQRNVIDWGMHHLHMSVREYYNIIETHYLSNNEVFFVTDSEVRNKNYLVHSMASDFTRNENKDYVSWRKLEELMLEERKKSSNILFFTTFNKNGYDLYGKNWIKSFIKISNYFNKFKAKIYYQGFTPEDHSLHSNIEWVNFDEEIPNHRLWKINYSVKNKHSGYVKTNCIRFSHKAFVIQDVLDKHDNDYLIWLDGDCIFKNTEYGDFPKNILNNKFMACQLEHAHDLNHIESGILIFIGKHPDLKIFNKHFKENYKVENVILMGQPYDGFIISKSLITSNLNFFNLNEKYGAGGIQSDPSLTFLHPEIKEKFIHNIGWTGKNQYEMFATILERDDILKKVQLFLFGRDKMKKEKKEKIFKKIEKLKRNKIIFGQNKN